MKKTELMLEFEEEQNRIAVVEHSTGKVYLPAYGEWLERKVLRLIDKEEAYDRLMSGGKKTLKEVANFYGLPIALSSYGDWLVFHDKPWASDYDWFSDCLKFGELPRIIHNLDIDFTGSWQDSLTLPDGWEEK